MSDQPSLLGRKPLPKSGPSFHLETECGLSPVCGIDEAGRGPLAGPVVAASVILNPKHLPDGIDDSKKLSEAKREELFEDLQDHAFIGVGMASVEEIDTLNILQASLLAMSRSFDALPGPAAFALVDGIHAPKLPCPAATVKGGDGRSLSIAAASIIAKVTRDRLMHALALDYPDYDWSANKGYGAPKHLRALRELGPTPHHRKSFAPVRNAI